MDPVTIILSMVAMFVSMVSGIKNRQTARQDTKALQEDAQDFNASQAELGREWEEEMYNEYKSPEAVFDQYRGLGASNTAALMASLGVSPAMSSPAVASSGGQSAMPFMGNTFAEMMSSLTNSIGSFYNNEKTKADTEKTKTETGYIPLVTETNVKVALGRLGLDYEKFGLDKREFEEVTKPLAMSTLNLNSVEIDKKLQETENLKAEFNNLVAQFEQIKSQTYKNYSDAGLAQAQTITEGYKQSNLAADTQLKGVEAALKDFDLKFEQELGFNPNLKHFGLEAVSAIKLKESYQSAFFTAENFLRSVRSTLNVQQNVRHAFDLTKSYLDSHWNNRGKANWNPAYERWLRDRGDYYKKAEDWINRNTRLGL